MLVPHCAAKSKPVSRILATSQDRQRIPLLPLLLSKSVLKGFQKTELK